jgi:6-phosphofructokinase 1
VLSAGGDAPGVNAVIRAVVKTATRVYGWRVLGIEDGFEGLLPPPRVVPLAPDDVRGLLPRGGSVLRCTNRGHFALRQVDGELVRDEGAYRDALATLERLALDALIVIGGEGSQRIAHEFAQLGVPVVGVAKTIDNDLAGTDFTFGFDTALDIATEAIDRLHTTAESHGRVILIEVMGRHAGWIALEAGIAGGADAILIPEIPFHVGKAAAKVREREAQGRLFSLIVVAEGARPAGGALVYQDPGGAGRAPRLGGIAARVSEEIERLTGRESRVVVLGHLQRGGTPTAFDRVLASCYGSAAVRAVAEGRIGHVVGWKGNDVVTIPLERAINEVRVVPRTHHLVRVARDLGITLAGDED